MKLFKSKKFLITVGIIIIIIFSYGVGSSGATLAIEETKVTHDGLLEKVKSVETKIEEEETKLKEAEDKTADAQAAIETEEKKLSDKETEVKEVLALVDDRDSLNSEIDELDKGLKGKNDELSSLSTQVDEKQAELEKIESGIVKKKEEPLELSAGVFIVGTDVPAGRYQVTNIGQGSNFIVHSPSGSLKVNTILGDGFGSGDYVFFADEGDTIENGARVKLIPVE